MCAPHQAPQPGVLAVEGRAYRESGFEGQWSLIAGIPQDWGKQKLEELKNKQTDEQYDK